MSHERGMGAKLEQKLCVPTLQEGEAPTAFKSKVPNRMQYNFHATLRLTTR